MATALVAWAAVGAFGVGSVLGVELFARHMALVRRERMRTALGAASVLEAASVSLECEGVSARVIAYAVRLSQRSQTIKPFVDVVSSNARLEELIVKAGLEGVLTWEDYRRARTRLAAMGCITGLLVGCVASSILMIIGATVGFIWGLTALKRALHEESRARAFVAERHLSQMIEVIVLGLKSGMSFDRALSLYHQRFSGSLSSAMALAQGQWAHGLIERSAGLRSVARSYDSPLFGRLSESVIRSLRFGTSLADNLAVLAIEARAVRKAKLEEKVAKAPVKMLLPVGGLILPAMLILIMGPILLDLMAGF